MSQPVRLLRIVRRAAWVAVAVSLLLVGGAWLLRDPAPAPAPAAIAIGGPFALTDHLGRAVSDQDYRGAYMLIYFGYINCPDICVPALDNMSAALDALGTAGDAIQPIFITVDPVRDTVEVMKAYAANFHPRLVALTGHQSAIDEVAEAYGVYSAREATGGETLEPYLVDHTARIFLMGVDGRYLTNFRYDTEPEEMADGIRSYF